jgi:hypothetical protein
MKPRDPIPGKDAARAEREKRLAEALRANLKRRKSAARSEASGKSREGRDTPPERAQDSNEDKG